MSDEPEGNGLDGVKLKDRVAALEKVVQLIAKGLYEVDGALEEWEGQRVVAAGTIAGVKFPGPES